MEYSLSPATRKGLKIIARVMVLFSLPRQDASPDPCCATLVCLAKWRIAEEVTDCRENRPTVKMPTKMSEGDFRMVGGRMGSHHSWS
jgi:hypothetical protein